MSDHHVYQPVQMPVSAGVPCFASLRHPRRGPPQIALVLAALVALACGSTGSDDHQAGAAGATPGGRSNGGSAGANQGSGGSSGGVTVAGAAPMAGAAASAGAAGLAGAGGAAGTAGSGSGGSGGGVGCGDRTCGPNEYCQAPCNGVIVGGSSAIGPPSCSPMPATCNGVPTCECVCGSFTSFCTPGAHAIQCGCA